MWRWLGDVERNRKAGDSKEDVEDRSRKQAANFRRLAPVSTRPQSRGHSRSRDLLPVRGSWLAATIVTVHASYIYIGLRRQDPYLKKYLQTHQFSNKFITVLRRTERCVF